MMDRDQLKIRIEKYYNSKGLNPEPCFNCVNSADCEAKSGSRKLVGRGSQMHLGQKYGAVARILVLSLDAGGKENSIGVTLDERTKIIESLDLNKLNPHMKGTSEILQSLLGHIVIKDELFQHFAMTNAAKCAGANSMDKLPSEIYQNCSVFQSDEIEMLKPQVIYAEGKDAVPLFIRDTKTLNPNFSYESYPFEEMNRYFLETGIENTVCKSHVMSIVKRYLKIIKWVDGGYSIFVACPHPSSRMGQWQSFRDLMLPLLNDIIRFKLGI
jgi:uracil-DNA glycosylase